MERVDGADEIVVAQGQGLSGIGLLSNTGVRFEAPETISGRARFEDVPRGGSDPDQPRRDMRLDGVAGEVLSPSPGLFDFRVADPALMSAIFRAYNHHLHWGNTPEQGYRDVTGTSRINGRYLCVSSLAPPPPQVIACEQ